jgi:hypothetical protein
VLIRRSRESRKSASRKRRRTHGQLTHKCTARKMLFEPLEDRQLLADYTSADVTQAIPDQGTVLSTLEVDLRCFSIAVLLLVLMGCGIQLEKVANTAINELGGEVRKGDDGRVSSFYYGDKKATDAGLGRLHLKGPANWTGLILDNTEVTDAGLIHLKGLTNLTGLNLDNTQVTDAGMIYLKGLTNLTGLSLSNTHVGDAGLEHLKGLTELSYLVLCDTQVSDAGLEHLNGLTYLSRLKLNHTQVSDTGMEYLKELNNLKRLSLYNIQVGDAGLDHLNGLTNLTDLDLTCTLVTDAGLEYLKELTNLRCLVLSHTNVSDESVKNLKAALPQCRIYHRRPNTGTDRELIGTTKKKAK